MFRMLLILSLSGDPSKIELEYSGASTYYFRGPPVIYRTIEECQADWPKGRRQAELYALANLSKSFASVILKCTNKAIGA